MVISRYLSEPNLQRMQSDLKFLLNTLDNYKGELDIAIRDNYFNIYYKGNSLAKIAFRSSGLYEVGIHAKFLTNTGMMQHFSKPQGAYFLASLDKESLHSVLQKKHIAQLCSNIKHVNNGEEITFEQMVITDNLNRDDYVIIDRQITDKELGRKRMDLLALKRAGDGNEFQFEVVEVKMGNNPELENEAANQLTGYMNHIQTNFSDYKYCYEHHYKQKKLLALPGLAFTPPTIEIIPEVKGVVYVCGYSGIAKGYLRTLKNNHPNIRVKQSQFSL